MKKILLICLIAMLYLPNIQAQKDTLDLLQGTWGLKKEGYVKIITNSKITSYLLNYGSLKVEYQYYLTNDPIAPFDKRKIGAVKNGKYILFYHEKSDSYFLHEIYKISENELTTQHIDKISSVLEYTKIKP